MKPRPSQKCLAFSRTRPWYPGPCGWISYNFVRRFYQATRLFRWFQVMKFSPNPASLRTWLLFVIVVRSWNSHVRHNSQISPELFYHHLPAESWQPALDLLDLGRSFEEDEKSHPHAASRMGFLRKHHGILKEAPRGLEDLYNISIERKCQCMINSVFTVFSINHLWTFRFWRLVGKKWERYCTMSSHIFGLSLLSWAEGVLSDL